MIFGSVPKATWMVPAVASVWDLSQRPTGCRQVQRLLDGISDVERLSLAMELRGRISVAARSACANYVLQKLIQVLSFLE